MIGRWQLHLPEHQLPNGWWTAIAATITREKGVFRLTPGSHDPAQDCARYLLTASTLDALDLIELTFRFADRVIRVAAQ
jgi:hypothetical protein